VAQVVVYKIGIHAYFVLLSCATDEGSDCPVSHSLSSSLKGESKAFPSTCVIYDFLLIYLLLDVQVFSQRK